MEEFLGIDVGGTNVKMGLVNRNGNILDKEKVSTLALRENGKFVPEFVKVIGEKLQQYKYVKKVGIGLPGTLSKDCTKVLEVSNIPELNGVKLWDILHDTYPNVHFYLENDANAAALGEYYFGKSKLPNSFILVTLGTGIGGGVIMDGQIFKGGDGNSMEIGHMPGQDGKTVEELIGKRGTVKMASDMLRSFSGASILSEEEITSKRIVQAAQQGDALALEVYCKVGVILGEALVSLVRMLDIKTILIGGGVAKTFNFISEDMYTTMSNYLTPYYTDVLDVRPATLANNAGIVGAASLGSLEAPLL